MVKQFIVSSGGNSTIETENSLDVFKLLRYTKPSINAFDIRDWITNAVNGDVLVLHNFNITCIEKVYGKITNFKD